MDISRPNILLLLSDQERYDVTVPAGPAVQTPHIDRLRQEGMTFRRAYTPISICTSARGSLLSGYYPHTHGMLNNCHEPDAVRRNFPTDIPTMGERLVGAGYRTTYTGKWHVGHDQRPEDFGFDYLGGNAGNHEAAFRRHQREHGIDPDDRPVSDEIRTADERVIAGKTSIPVEATRPYFLASETIDALRSHANGDAPFFHRLDFVGPHHPYVVPEPYASMYDPADIERWDNFAETDHGKPQVHANYRSYRGVDHLSWADWAEVIAKYFGFVTLIDDQIGRVLDAVDQDLLDETVVIHSADHGDFTGSHRQFNKGPLMYEETYHIPLFVRWPGIVDPGSTCNEFVRLLDLMPTVLDVAEAPIPSGIHGRSIRPLLRGHTPPEWPQTVFAEYHGDEFGLYSQRMVRSKRYKYVYNPPDIDEFYDLETDPAELHNVIDHPEYTTIREDMRQRLLSWMEETADPILTWSKAALGPTNSRDQGAISDHLTVEDQLASRQDTSASEHADESRDRGK